MSPAGSLPRLLLVTGVSPGRGNVGREYLRAACRLLPAERISVFSFDPAGPQTGVPELVGMRTHLEPPPDERGSGVPGWAWIRHLTERSIERHDIPPLIDKIVAFGKAGGVDRLWVPLHSPTTIRVAKPAAEALGVPLITTVWDPPSYKLRQFGLGRRMRRVLMRKFDSTVRHAIACGTASDPMRDLYGRLYHTRSVTMILGAPRPQALAEPDSEGPFRLGPHHDNGQHDHAQNIQPETGFRHFRNRHATAPENHSVWPCPRWEHKRARAGERCRNHQQECI